MRNEDKNVKIAQETLTELVEKAGACENRDELNKIAAGVLSKLANHPGVIDRVCEAFNSNKALYKLSNKDPEVRGGDFLLLNAGEIKGLINKTAGAREMKKLASLKPRFYETPKAAEKPIEMKKTASAFNPADCIELDTRPGFENITICNVLDHQEDVLTKLAFAIDQADLAEQKALDKLERKISHLSKEAKASIASIGAAHYGELFKDIAPMFGEVSLKKFASAPKLPEEEIYKLMDDCVERAYIKDNYKGLLKAACADVCDNLRKLAGAYNLARLSMRKRASVVDMATGLVGGTVLPEALGLKDENKAKAYSSIMNQNVGNLLRELEMKRNFYEIYNDDYISTFPIHQVQDAYNAAIQKLPEKLKRHPSSATQLIRSWVTKTLSHGGITSAADAADVLEAASKLRFERSVDENPFEEED